MSKLDDKTKRKIISVWRAVREARSYLELFFPDELPPKPEWENVTWEVESGDIQEHRDGTEYKRFVFIHKDKEVAHVGRDGIRLTNQNSGYKISRHPTRSDLFKIEKQNI